MFVKAIQDVSIEFVPEHTPVGEGQVELGLFPFPAGVMEQLKRARNWDRMNSKQKKKVASKLCELLAPIRLMISPDGKRVSDAYFRKCIEPLIDGKVENVN